MLLRRLGWTTLLASEAFSQARFPFRSPDDIAVVQRRRLRNALGHARRSSPFYREALDRNNLRPDRAEVSDLARLPLLERADLGPDRPALRVASDPTALRLESSGTTGQRVVVTHDLAGLIRGTAHGIRERSVLWPSLGRRVPRRELLIVANPSSGELVRERCRENLLALPKTAPQRRVLFFDTRPEDALRVIAEFQPEVLVTYGSYLARLFLALEKSPDSPFPAIVVFYGDGLGPHVRARLHDRGVACFSRYKAIEASHLGFECEHHTGLHVNVDLYPIRVVDASGQEVAPGTYGELVISNLVNRRTLLFNYRLGDVVAMLDRPCPCGRKLPLMSFPEGRCDDMVLCPDGTARHYQEVHRWFYQRPVIEYRVVQSQVTTFDFEVVAVPGTDLTTLERDLRAISSAELGANVKITIRFVDAIPRTAGGKHKPVLSVPWAERLSART